MRRIRKYRKPILILAGMFLLWFSVQSAILLKFGDVSYQLTFETNYQKQNSDSYIMSTSWANIPTNEKFINVANRPTCPGFVGNFMISASNLVYYEYGMFSPQLSTFVEDGFESRIDTLNGRIIHTVFKNAETGFIIPWQDDMSHSFLLYPSNYGTEHRTELINSLANVKFKK